MGNDDPVLAESVISSCHNQFKIYLQKFNDCSKVHELLAIHAAHLTFKCLSVKPCLQMVMHDAFHLYLKMLACINKT